MDVAGDAVRPALMISDIRAREQAARIAAHEAYGRLTRASARVTPDLMVPKIAWLRDAEPAADARARWLVSPNDFLVQRLTGEVVTDPATASKFWFDPAGDGSYPEPLRDLGVDVERLPPVVTGQDAMLPVRAELRERYGFPESARVVLSTYDAMCAVYGSGVARVGEACDVSGTVTSFRVVTERSERDPDGRVFISPHLSPGRYLAGGSNNLSGGVIEWARQVLYAGEADPYRALGEEAGATPPGAGGLLFLPYLLGERAPVWDTAARGVFFGLGRSHGRADMARAVIEGLGYAVLDIADRLAGIGVGVDSVAASGGVARIPIVSQVKADMLGVPYVLNEELESTALGAAIVAGVNAGDWASIEDAIGATVRRSAEIDPDPARTAMYRDFFGLYRELYGRLQGLFADREVLLADHAQVLRSELEQRENL
jgi:xylulokinase